MGYPVKTLTIVLSVWSLMLVATSASAQQIDPCKADREKLCGDVEAGEGRVMKCMHQNRKKLSKACKDHRTKGKQKVLDAAAACNEDTQKFCSDVTPGAGRIAVCLNQHKDELKPECKKKLDKGKAKVKKATKACKADAKKLCKDVKPGKGRILKCLSDNESRLTQSCKDSLTMD